MLFYHIAVDVTLATGKMVYAFIIAGAIGIAVGIILCTKNSIKFLPATLLAFLSAFIFHIFFALLNFSFWLINGFMIFFIAAGYLLFSLTTFAIAAGICSELKQDYKNNN